MAGWRRQQGRDIGDPSADGTGGQAHPFFSYAALFLAVRFSLQLAVSRVFHHGYLSSSASVIEHDHLLERMLISQAKVVDCPFGSGHDPQPIRRCTAAPVAFYGRLFDPSLLLIEYPVWQPVWHTVSIAFWQHQFAIARLVTRLAPNFSITHLAARLAPSFQLPVW